MSKRYVWDKYNAIKVPVKGAPTRLSDSSSATTEDGASFFFYVSNSVEVVNGKFRLVSPSTIQVWYDNSFDLTNKYYAYVTYWDKVSNPGNALFDKVYFGGTGTSSTLVITMVTISFSVEGSCPVTIGDGKGSLVGKVSSSKNSTYPQNGVSGSFWYSYNGEDIIDPSSVTYSTDSPKGGQTIAISVKASEENKYGGTIEYQYSYSTDNGGSWNNIGNPTTSITSNVTIPKGVTSFQARVLAKDTYGFTSSTHVFGKEVVVTNNVAPGTPGSIVLPSTIFGGRKFTLSWGPSTDTDGNLSGYELYRSTNDGTSWDLVYKGPLTQAEDTVTFGVEHVQYRVRAYDTDNEYSSYRSSASKDIINNYPPSAPKTIIVPDLIGGSEAVIKWDSSEDLDSNISGYVLERSVDSGEFTQVYKGSEVQFTDTISNSWDTVQYRVKSYDTYNFESEYTTSDAKEVSHNNPPVITGEDTDLGVKTDFSYEYTITDSDVGQSLTATESIDGKVIRTYTPTSGTPNTFTLSKEEFLSLDPKSKHTALISVSDGKVTVTRTLTFSREITSFSVELVPPFEADAMVTRMYCFVTGNFPTGCTFRFLASNNPFDDEPVWQDVTSEVKMREKFYFTNSSKTGDKWGVSIKLEVERNEVPEDTKIFVYKIEGGYDGRGASE